MPDSLLPKARGNLTVIVRVREKNSVVARYGVPVEVSTAGSEWVLRGRDARAFLEVLQKEAPERLKQLTQGAELQNENQPDW